MYELCVDAVYAGDEDGMFVLAFEANAAENALVFQLSDRFNRQDAMLNMDSYSISNGAGTTVYGGVVSAGVTDSVLALGFRSEAAATLGLASDIRLRLPDGEAVESAVVGLRRLGIAVRCV